MQEPMQEMSEESARVERTIRERGMPMPDVHPSMLDLVPEYVARRRDDLRALREALGGPDFDTIRRIAHRFRGSGASYGFPRLSEIGERLEDAATDADTSRARAHIEALSAALEPYEGL